MNSFEYAPSSRDLPKQLIHHHMPATYPQGNVNIFDFNADLTVPMSAEIQIQQQKEAASPPIPTANPNSSDGSSYTEATVHGYALYSSGQHAYTTAAPSAGVSYPPPSASYSHHPINSSSDDVPPPLSHSLPVPPPSDASKLMASSSSIPPLSPPLPVPPPPHPFLPTEAGMGLRARPMRLAKKRRSYYEEDEFARGAKEGRRRRGGGVGGGGLGRRFPPFPHRPLGKRPLTNEEEYELMDFMLMKKIEEMNVLKEALDAQLISTQNFAQKQTQFLDSFPFE